MQYITSSEIEQLTNTALGNWYVYLLVSDTRTYVGSTTNPTRRLRQHNREITGGARSTAGRKWEMRMYLSGFENRSSACRWERILKHRARGVADRMYAFAQVSIGSCPGRTGKQTYLVPDGLRLWRQNIKTGELV